jgi:hypothetical protein
MSGRTSVNRFRPRGTADKKSVRSARSSARQGSEPWAVLIGASVTSFTSVTGEKPENQGDRALGQSLPSEALGDTRDRRDT